MKPNNDTKISRFISLALRHHPEAAGITLDSEGYADTELLIKGVAMKFHGFDMKALERIVAEDEKTRYSFNGDKSKIRANQGHSVAGVNPGLAEKTPPDVLYHGTAERFMESIHKEGLLKMSRQYVHLSIDEETAEKVGKRHGKPVIITIDTAKMHRDGFKFFLSENGVWLTDSVPTEYFINERTM